MIKERTLNKIGLFVNVLIKPQRKSYVFRQRLIALVLFMFLALRPSYSKSLDSFDNKCILIDLTLQYAAAYYQTSDIYCLLADLKSHKAIMINYITPAKLSMTMFNYNRRINQPCGKEQVVLDEFEIEHVIRYECLTPLRQSTCWITQLDKAVLDYICHLVFYPCLIEGQEFDPTPNLFLCYLHTNHFQKAILRTDYNLDRRFKGLLKSFKVI